MEDPPARNAAWRHGKYVLEMIFSLIFIFLGFNVPANYDDVGLNCGGLGVQKSNGRDFKYIYGQYIYEYLGGKCGICRHSNSTSSNINTSGRSGQLEPGDSGKPLVQF